MDRRGEIGFFAAIGSLNLDPRSIDINTEIALLVDSPVLAESLVVPMLDTLPGIAYRLSENDEGKLLWTTYTDGVVSVVTSEPQTGNWRRFKAFLSRVFPENQL